MSFWQRRKRWIELLGQFLVGQGAVQAINLGVGFCLLRWLSTTSYAQVSVALAFQGTIGILIDLGFSGSIIALSGARGMEREVVGRYLRSARHYRNRSMAVMSVAAAIAFPLITARQPWEVSTKALLFASVMAALYFQGWGLYSAPLLIHRRLHSYYRAQISSALLRAGLCALLYACGLLNAWLASAVAALATAVTGWLYRHAAAPFLVEPEEPDPAASRDMIRYLAPVVPGVIFSAFQGSVVTSLTAIFGRTKNIAEVAALGRLGQVFGILTAFNGVVIGPLIARTPRELLLQRYVLILTGLVSFGGCLVAFACWQPGALLWLLGPKYQHLRVEVGWIVTVACVDFISSGMFAMNSSRRWLFWWGTVAYISVLIVVQGACIGLMDLSKTLQVIQFSLITSVSILFVHIATAIYGFRFGAPPTAEEEANLRTARV